MQCDLCGQRSWLLFVQVLRHMSSYPCCTSWKANVRPLLDSSQRTHCSPLCFAIQAVIWETIKVLFVATQVENDSWLRRRPGMFCTLRLQAILVKSFMRPSNSTFSIVDIVREGIQESKEAGDLSRHLVVQFLPPLIFLSILYSHTYTHIL